MNSGMIGASLTAIAGSLVGALGSAITTWITARHQDRRDLLGKQIAQPEELYSDFIGESYRILVDAMEHNGDQIQSQAMTRQDPLIQFSDACRTELAALERQL